MKSGTPKERTTAGALLLIGGVLILGGILAAQSLFPGYDASNSAISDLGAPIELAYHQSPGILTIVQPASIIFVVSVFISSILIFQAGRLLRTATAQKWFHRFLKLYGIGGFVVTVSYVPYYAYANQVVEGTVSGDPLAIIVGALVHLSGATLIFVFGGLSAVASYKLWKRPIAYLPVVLGIVVLGAFALNLVRVDFGLGNGGIERVAAYPLFLWTAGTGAALRRSRKCAI